MSHPVHQIRCRWSPATLLGTRGMGPVESTLPTDQLAMWDRFLRDHVWAVGPEPGFTCLLNGAVGILVRKVTTATEGRQGSDAHVLLSQGLTPLQALGLTSWDGWTASTLEVLPWADLAATADSGVTALRARARTLPADRLTALFTQLLTAPGEDYTVVGEVDPLVMTCALGDLVGRTPTFASDEADDNGTRLPTAVFLKQAPVSTTAATRRRLVSAPAHVDATVAGFASAAVAAYLADGVDGIAGIRRPAPPTDGTQAHAWAAEAQLAPGVLADVRRLPLLPDTVLAGLTGPDALQRVRAVASGASSSDLGAAIDGRLPRQVATVLLREAVARVFRDPTDDALLYRLHTVGPLPLDIVAEHAPADLDHGAFVAQALLSPGDRRVLLERMARTVSYADLVRWIAERAATDPHSALGGFTTLCGRSGSVSRTDVDVLVAHGALVAAVRALSESAWQAAAQLTRLLGALPKRALTDEVVAELLAHGDAVLIHALDTVVTGRSRRALIHREIRRRYYHAFELLEPVSPQSIDHRKLT